MYQPYYLIQRLFQVHEVKLQFGTLCTSAIPYNIQKSGESQIYTVINYIMVREEKIQVEKYRYFDGKLT